MQDNCHGAELSRLLQKLRPFQREAFDFATQGVVSDRQFHADQQNHVAVEYDPQWLGKGRILLADEMGLGKTVTSLAIMTHFRSEWPLLILCPASLRHTWPGEIEKFLPSLPPSAIYVVNGFDDADFYENEKKRSQVQIVVATYSLLQNRSAAAKCLQQFQFQCVIVDESQNLKQKTSQRTKLAIPLMETANRLVLLSGTPALARPVELWTQVSVIAPDLFADNYTQFTKRYCNARRGRFGWDVSGLSHPDELYSKLRQIMVRRLKNDVLTELPPKQRTIVPIQIPKGDKRKECESLMKELTETRQSVAELVGEEADGANFEARKLFMQCYQASGVAKSPAVCDYLLEWLRASGSQKVLVFAHHKAVLDAIEVTVSKEFKGVGHIRIDGTVNSQERAARVRKFQTSSRIRVAVLSITAAGVGLTLTAASNVMFAELYWTPGILAQAEDRCHRIGQVNSVNVMYLVSRDPDLTVDPQLWNMLGRKTGTLGRLLDGKKNSTMNATVQDGKPKSGQSAQDEIQDFFSESTPTEAPSAKGKGCVKGTIMSFFKKQTDAVKTKASTSAIQQAPKGLQRERSVSNCTVPDNVAWTCNACTFINKSKTASGSLSCEMCGTRRIETVGTKSITPTVTPCSSRKEPKRKPNPAFVESSPSHIRDVEVIVIDSPPVRKMKRTREINSSIQATPELNRGNTPQHHQLLFSVSRNTSRITINYHNGESSLTNFEVEDVVTRETADDILEAKTRRESSATTLRVDFNDSAVQGIVDTLDPTHVVASSKQEIKEFVRSYLMLRGVEQRLLQESGRPYPAHGLKQKVLQLMAPQANGHCTERYIGGARERAKENMESGDANDDDLAILQGLRCAWCGGKLPSVSAGATYCSRECAEEGRLKRGGLYASTQLRTQVFALEGGRCRKCGIDAGALYTRVRALEPAERLNALCNANWKLPRTGKALERLLQSPKEGDFWQVDHIRAVSEGGGGCDTDNLQTLCVPCHAEETEKLRARLRLHGTGQKDEASPDSKRQCDIRSMFSRKKSKTSPFTM